MRRQAALHGSAVLGIAALVLAGCGTASTAQGRSTTAGAEGAAVVAGTGPGSATFSQFDEAGGWAVTGTFKMEGGPVKPGASSVPARPLPGVVMFRDKRGRTTDITAGPAGLFAGYLPAGTYTVTARTEQIRQQNPDGSVSDPPCAGPVTVVVQPERTTTVALVCFVP